MSLSSPLRRVEHVLSEAGVLRAGIESAVLATPTGEVRNLLTDAQIRVFEVIQILEKAYNLSK